MKATKKEKDLALRGAENLNKLRIDANGRSSTYVELVSLLKEYKVPYYTHTVSRLIEQGWLKGHDTGNYIGNTGLSYVFKDEPIHYSVLIPIYEEIRNKGRVHRKNGEKRAEERAKKFKTTAQSKSISEILRDSIVNPKTFPVSNITDADLVAELRKRGYEVTAEKITVIKL